jgi:hypothetical protein
VICRIWSTYPFADYGIGYGLGATTGKILSAEIRIKKTNFRSLQYEPFVRYEYKINEINYYGSNISVHNHKAMTKKEAEYEVGKYKTGSTVLVFYSPNNHTFSLLNKNFPWDYILITIIFVPGMLIILNAIIWIFNK